MLLRQCCIWTVLAGSVPMRVLSTQEYHTTDSVGLSAYGSQDKYSPCQQACRQIWATAWESRMIQIRSQGRGLCVFPRIPMARTRSPSCTGSEVKPGSWDTLFSAHGSTRWKSDIRDESDIFDENDLANVTWLSFILRIGQL